MMITINTEYVCRYGKTLKSRGVTRSMKKLVSIAVIIIIMMVIMIMIMIMMVMIIIIIKII